MREIKQPGEYQYVFGPYAEPIAAVKPGETVVIHTIDAFGNELTSEDQDPGALSWENPNPQTGPLLIKGAEPGDTLAVKIEAIEPTRDWAVSATLPYFGGLTSTRFTASLQEPLKNSVWIYKQTKSGGFQWRDRWEIPWA